MSTDRPLMRHTPPESGRRWSAARTVVLLVLLATISAAALALSGGGDARLESASLVLLGIGLLGAARFLQQLVVQTACLERRAPELPQARGRGRHPFRRLGPATPQSIVP